MICDISVMWYSLRNVNHVDCLFVWWMLWCLNSLFTSVKILSSSLQRSHIFRLKKISLKKRKMFSVFKVLHPTSTNNEVTHQVKGFLISRVVARTGSLPPSPCECAHRVWHQGPSKMNLKYFQMFSCMAYKYFCQKLNCTYWALAHIVHVVVTAGKQPTTWDLMDGNVLAWDWWDSRWVRGTLTASFRMPLF